MGSLNHHGKLGQFQSGTTTDQLPEYKVDSKTDNPEPGLWGGMVGGGTLSTLEIVIYKNSIFLIMTCHVMDYF